MKTITLILTFSAIAIHCNAQNSFNKSQIKVQGTTFLCKKSKSGKSINVKNYKNKLYNKKSTLSIGHSNAIKMDKNFYVRQNRLITKAFTEKRLKKLKESKARIGITYYIKNGKVVELSYGFPAETKISPEELLEIEKIIKKNIIVLDMPRFNPNPKSFPHLEKGLDYQLLNTPLLQNSPLGNTRG